jgi:hypothetical protein
MKVTESLESKISELQKMESACTMVIKTNQEKLSTVQRDLYDLTQKLLHVKEIYRLASIEFPRLRNEPHMALSEADRAELEKWIGRAQSVESMVSITKALEELSKYYPTEIKSNLYGLVQKIIIEGAHGSIKGKKQNDRKS